MAKRICTDCKKEKELNKDNFYKAIRNQEGFHLQCRTCMIEKQKANNRKKKEWENMFVG